MLMALRFVLARLFSARGRPFVSAAATTTAVATVTAMPAVAEQMHADERYKKQHPNPVL
ncbi:MAG: hypothetical protein ABL907_23495 [Hyphomicrobium sp.]